MRLSEMFGARRNCFIPRPILWYNRHRANTEEGTHVCPVLAI